MKEALITGAAVFLLSYLFVTAAYKNKQGDRSV